VLKNHTFMGELFVSMCATSSIVYTPRLSFSVGDF
jgi:hypothetical protein